MTVDEAIKVAKENCKDPAALAYLHGIRDSVLDFGTEGLRTQLLYFLTNTCFWRGELAREVKKVMRAFIKKTE